jgi:hypothetical protein
MPEQTGFDDLSRWLGLRWEAADRVRITVRPEHINAAGLRSGDERIATISISINYVQTAREGDVVCTTTLDRRNDRVAVMRSEVTHEDGRLIATAVGSFSIFPSERLGGHERPAPAPHGSV